MRKRTPLRMHKVREGKGLPGTFLPPVTPVLPPVTPVLPPVTPDPVASLSTSTNPVQGVSYHVTTENGRPASTTSAPGVSYPVPTEYSCPTSISSLPGGSYQTSPSTSRPTPTPTWGECSDPDTVPLRTSTPPSTPVRRSYSTSQDTPVRQIHPTQVSAPSATPYVPGAAPVPRTPESQRPRRTWVA